MSSPSDTPSSPPWGSPRTSTPHPSYGYGPVALANAYNRTVQSNATMHGDTLQYPPYGAVMVAHPRMPGGAGYSAPGFPPRFWDPPSTPMTIDPRRPAHRPSDSDDSDDGNDELAEPATPPPTPHPCPDHESDFSIANGIRVAIAERTSTPATVEIDTPPSIVIHAPPDEDGPPFTPKPGSPQTSEASPPHDYASFPPPAPVAPTVSTALIGPPRRGQPYFRVKMGDEDRDEHDQELVWVNSRGRHTRSLALVNRFNRLVIHGRKDRIAMRGLQLEVERLRALLFAVRRVPTITGTSSTPMFNISPSHESYPSAPTNALELNLNADTTTSTSV